MRRQVLVSLVGAGPGDPELLTRRAGARLRRADLVLYDALVDERVLKIARRAQCFFVGKRAGRHSVTQQGIHAVMIRAARRGRRVVRLKGGDPFLFGRGGEEALALKAAGIAFEVVPGISSAIAAPELAGIPVTHRGVSHALLVVGGFDEAAFRDSIGALVPNGVTLVVLMGMARRREIAAALLAFGWRDSTPAVVVMDASRTTQQVWRGTLKAMAHGEAVVNGDGAATLVVGDVAALELSSAGLKARSVSGGRRTAATSAEAVRSAK